jgi:acyl carrier protein
MNETIISGLEQYIVTKVLKQPSRRISPDEPLISSGLIDSFHLVDLSVFIEEQFGVRIDDTELNSETFDSVAQLANLIINKQV